MGVRRLFLPLLFLFLLVSFAFFLSLHVFGAGGVFTSTEHGGTDANSNSTTGAQRPANTPSGYATISFPAGHCNHCHDYHASLDTTTHTPNNDLLFGLNTVTFCFTCHTNPNTFTNGFSQQIWPGSAVYTLANVGHYNGNCYWPGTNPVARPSTDKGKCLNCHNPHGRSLSVADSTQTGGPAGNDDLGKPFALTASNPVPNMLARLEENLCFGCHNTTPTPGSGQPNEGAKNIQILFQNMGTNAGSTGVYYSHPVAKDTGTGLATPTDRTPGYHRSYERMNFTSATTRHAECMDCHNPHYAQNTGTPGSALHTFGSNKIGPANLGVYGVSVSSWPITQALYNGTLQSAPSFTLTQLTSTTNNYQYELCLRCHSSYSVLPTFSPPNDVTDVSREINPNNGSYHPIVKKGRLQDPAINNNFEGGLSVTSTIVCTDCHTRNYQVGTADYAQGPHANQDSTQQQWGVTGQKILAASAPTGAGTAAEEHVLCLKCHKYSVYYSGGAGSRINHPINTGMQVNAKNYRNIWCQSCHGGRNPGPDGIYGNSDDSSGGLHGTNAGVGTSGTSPLSQHFMNGAAIVGFTDDGTTPGNLTCYTTANPDTLSNCKQHSGGATVTANFKYTQSASVEQYNYRWCQDNAATPTLFYATQNNAYTNASTTAILRLRVQVGESNNVSSGATYFKLQYSNNGGGTWTDVVNNGAATTEEWQAANSGFVADGGTVTKILTATGLGADNAGTYEEVKPTGSFTLQNSSYEYDFVITGVAANVLNQQNYLFRVVKTDGTGTPTTALDFYNQTISLTTGGPILEQYNYRWYNDNSGTDTALTPLAAQNTQYAGAPDQNYRLRLQIGESFNVQALNYQFKLQYSSDGGTNWSDVANSPPGTAHWQYVNSAFVTNGNPIQTKLLSAVTETATHNLGSYVEQKPTGTFTLQNSDNEFDFVIAPVVANRLQSTQYLFRAVSTDGAGTSSIRLRTYNNYATIQTFGPPILKQYNYRWYQDNSATDTSLTARGAEDTGITTHGTSIYRLRVQVGEANNSNANGKYFKLMYDNSATFTAPKELTGTTVAWNYATSPYVADGAAVNALLLSTVTETSTHSFGTYEESKPTGATPNPWQLDDREYDFVITGVPGTGANNLKGNTTYYFRVYETDATGTSTTALNSYVNTAQLTTLYPYYGADGTNTLTDRVTIFSDAAYSSLIYPQNTVLTAGSTIYVEIISDSDGGRGKTMEIHNYNEALTGTQVTFPNPTGTGPYTYRASIALPASTGQYSLNTLLIDNNRINIQKAGGPLLYVGTSTPTQYMKTFNDSGYTVQSDAFATGQPAYVEMVSATDGTPAVAQSFWQLYRLIETTNEQNRIGADTTNGYAGNAKVASGTPASVTRTALNTYRLSFTMPTTGVVDQGWYTLRCVVRTSAGTILARGPNKFIQVNTTGPLPRAMPLTEIREAGPGAPTTRDKIGPQVLKWNSPTSIIVSDGAQTLPISIDLSDEMTGKSEIAAAEYSMDYLVKEGEGTPMTLQHQQGSSGGATAATATATSTIPIDLWRSGTSHSIFVRGKDSQGNWGVTRGIMVHLPMKPGALEVTTGAPGVTTVSSRLLGRGSISGFVVSAYQNPSLTLPFQTPGGIITGPKGPTYLLITPLARIVLPPVLSIDAPTKEDSRKGEALLPYNPPAESGALSLTGQYVYRWDIRPSLSAPSGLAKISLFLPPPLLSSSYPEEIEGLSGDLMKMGDSSSIMNEGYLILRSTPSSLPADGTSESAITAKLINAYKEPIPGRLIIFDRLSGGGHLSAIQAVTDSQGEAKAVYKAGITADTATIRASDMAFNASKVLQIPLSISAFVEITLTASSRSMRVMELPKAPKVIITLEAFPQTIPADGFTTSKIVAKVTDENGIPVRGKVIFFEIRKGEGTMVTGREGIQTDSLGRAEATYLAGKTPGTVIIRAFDPLSGSEAEVGVTLARGGPASIDLVADPTSIPADGISQSRITATVRDLRKQPMADIPVKYALNDPLNGLLTVIREKTDITGESLATYTAGLKPGRIRITAMVTSPLDESLGQSFISEALASAAFSPLSTRLLAAAGIPSAAGIPTAANIPAGHILSGLLGLMAPVPEPSSQPSGPLPGSGFVKGTPPSEAIGPGPFVVMNPGTEAVPPQLPAQKREMKEELPPLPKGSQLLTRTVGFIGNPKVSSDEKNLYLIWGDENQEAGAYSLFFTRYLPGKGWGKKVNIATKASRAHLDMSIFEYDLKSIAGTLYAVWKEQRNGKRDLFIRRSSNSGATWEREVPLKVTPGDFSAPSLATRDGKVLHLAWIDDRIEGLPQAYYRKSLDGGKSWQKEERLSLQQKYVNSPKVAVDPAGRAHLVWSGPTPDWKEGRAGETQIYYTVREEGKGWRKEVPVAEPLSYDPDLYCDTLGRLHLVYLKKLGVDKGMICYRRSDDHGRSWGKEIQIAPLQKGSVVYPAIAGKNDFLTVAWQTKASVQVTRSSDSGKSWKSAGALFPEKFNGHAPAVSLFGGKEFLVWHSQLAPKVDGLLLQIFKR